MKLKRMFAISAMLMVVLISSCKKDDDSVAGPTIVSTNPDNDAISIAINSKISIIFSEAMDSTSITTSTFTIQNGSAIVDGTIESAGSTATFTSAVNLAANTIYTGNITKGVKNKAGTSMAQTYNWSFTTGSIPDVSVPTVILTDPLNGTTEVATNHHITATFSKPMDPLTITTSTFKLKQGSSTVSGTVTYTGSIATFIPSAALEQNKIYTATITTGAKDIVNHALSVNHSFSFTTANSVDVVLPVINSTDPINNSTGISRNKIIAVTFSEAMNPSTINSTTFTLKQGVTSVPGTVGYSGTTATFTPTDILAVGSNYTATLTTGAKDKAGNAIAANVEWNFTTGGTASNLNAVDLGTAANYVILAKTAITNISISAITGDLGLSPAATSYITGFALTNATGYATSSQITGKIYAADMVSPTPINLTTAVNNMITAYTDVAGRPNPDFFELGTGNIGGKTLVPGLYKWTNNVTIPTNVTISGGADDVWIFQISGNLTMSSAIKITLTGGAQAKNIFWQVSGEATLGTTSHFEGNILSMTGITLKTGASIHGRTLAQTAVILDSNAVTKP